MKSRYLLTPLAALGFACAATWGAHLGDTREAVIEELGQPTLASGNEKGLETLTYPTGEIRLREGVVYAIRLSAESEPPTQPAETPEVSVQSRIAELEARVAELRTRLARAEAAAQSARTSSASYQWIIAPPATATYSPTPQAWRGATPRVTITPAPMAVIAGRAGDGL